MLAETGVRCVGRDRGEMCRQRCVSIDGGEMGSEMG